MYACRVVADSVSEVGKRITTFEVTYPRSIHSELLTHGLLSKNSASSRAIPIAKLMAQITHDPALPIYWGSAKPGMQAGDELPPEVIEVCKRYILDHRDAAVRLVADLERLGMHKQDANRYLEPWMYITVLVTATEWNNFFALRCHPAAHPSLQKIAYMMRDARNASTPARLREGDWHAPFSQFGLTVYSDAGLLKVCAARCARVSYLTHNGEHDPAADAALADRLASAGHWSPFEHIAQALADRRERSGRFFGWRQYRADVDPNFGRVGDEVYP